MGTLMWGKYLDGPKALGGHPNLPMPIGANCLNEKTLNFLIFLALLHFCLATFNQSPTCNTIPK
jgi:hypothetical protein